MYACMSNAALKLSKRHTQRDYPYLPREGDTFAAGTQTTGQP